MQNAASGSTVTKVEKPSILKAFPDKPKLSKKMKLPLFLWVFLTVAAGIGTGWLMSGKSGAMSSSQENAAIQKEMGVTKTPNEEGALNSGAKYDEVEGKLVEGGIQGEGTHHLERTGGQSQNVYLTSTVIDLQSYIGKTVHVWGETGSSQKGGWLMDVAKIKIVD